MRFRLLINPSIPEVLSHFVVPPPMPLALGSCTIVRKDQGSRMIKTEATF